MKRILAIDGGGIRGLYAATFLSEIEKMLEIQISDYFELICGTSTGAIISAALACGIPAETIKDLYIKEGAAIFRKRNVVPFIKSHYGSEKLYSCLKKQFKNISMGEVKTNLLITSFNITTGLPVIFKSVEHKDYYMDRKRSVVDCIMCSTAAPTYFDPYFMDGCYYVDGGVGANNPALVGYTEALGSRLGWKKEEVYVLSIGTLNEAMQSKAKKHVGYKDVQQIISWFMNAESQYSSNITRLLLDNDHYLRINRTITDNFLKMDNPSSENLEYMRGVGVEDAKKYISVINDVFIRHNK